jgi:hypothetical protein
MDSAQRQQRLEALGSEPDWQKRRLVALALLGDALAPAGITPIVVGGAALELYTAGGYSTKDVDLALPTSPLVEVAFAELGFLKQGRYWYRDDLDLLFEAPAPAGLPGETAPRTVLEIEGLPVVIIGVADLLIDRLRGWVHWQSTEDRRWATRLAVLYRDQLDWAYLAGRTAGDAQEAEALAQIEQEVGR